MKKEIIYAWACDLSLNRGEGLLANIFLKELSSFSNKKIVCKSIYESKSYKKGKEVRVKKYTINLKKDTFSEKYFSPFFGFLFVWKKYLQGEKVAYINFLPLWNFFLFFLLPPNTILGPITGNRYTNEVRGISTFIRKYIFPVLYKINLFIVFRRLKFVFFSTDILKKYINKKNIKKSFFNYNLKGISIQKRINKDKIIVIYYRKHETKENIFHFNLIKKLSNLDFKIHVFGNNINIKKVINHNFMSFKDKNLLLKKSMFAINSGDNFYSFFLLDCISNHVKIFYDSKSKPHEFLVNKKQLIPIDFNNSEKSYKKIKKSLRYRSTPSIKNNFLKVAKNMKKRSISYFSQFKSI